MTSIDSIVVCPALRAAFVAPLRHHLEKRDFFAKVVQYPGLGRTGTFDVPSAEAAILKGLEGSPGRRRGLLGYSMGGFFARRVAALNPGLVDFLALLAP